MTAPENSTLVGRNFSKEVAITNELIDRFAQLSGDFNPIHNSDEEARELGFQQRIAHGVIQASVISAIVGMELPGPGSVIQSMDMKWLKPSFPGDQIAVTLEITEEHQSVQTVVCRVEVKERTRGLISRGSVQVGVGGVHD